MRETTVSTLPAVQTVSIQKMVPRRSTQSGYSGFREEKTDLLALPEGLAALPE
jgi:hypothetical protein